MKLEAQQRLASTDWMVTAMPQIIADEDHSGRLFEDFDMLTKEHFLFDHRGHEIWGYRLKSEPDLRIIVALDANGIPVYINEVTKVALAFTEDSKNISNVLHSGLRCWTQSSVAFSASADRAALKGLATKVFWEHLASPGNVAITDSQQTPAGATFWKKILTGGAKYMVLNIDDTYRSNYLRVVSGSERWTDASHLQYDVHQAWSESSAGKLMRIAVTTGTR